MRSKRWIDREATLSTTPTATPDKYADLIAAAGSLLATWDDRGRPTGKQMGKLRAALAKATDAW
jgi:hypothetical protein